MLNRKWTQPILVSLLEILNTTAFFIRVFIASLVIVSATTTTVQATTISLNIIDASNEGLNDTTATAPVGGNTGLTLGDQRRLVFEFAAALLSNIIDSSVTITINAQFNPLTCTSSTAILGNGGPATVHFDNPPNNPYPFANTYYVQALANRYNGFDQSTINDINMTFNSSVDNNNSCLNNRNWYYGLDGNGVATDIDLLSTVLHEMLHGLGFVNLVNAATGARFNNRDDIYMRMLEDHSDGKTWNQLTNAERAASAIDDPDLHWIGANVVAQSSSLTSGTNQGHMRMHAPSTLQDGASVSHFSSSTSPFELMEPILTGPVDSIGLAKALLEDIGWTVFPSNAPVISEIADTTIQNAATSQIEFSFIDNDTASALISVSASSSNTSIIDDNNLILTGNGRARQLSVTPILGVSGMVDITVSIDDGNSTDTTVFQINVVSDLPPMVSITNPLSGTTSLVSQQSFNANANDIEDGNISSSISWLSSIDGAIGSGGLINPVLSDGNHLISASVIDSNSNSETAVITIDVIAYADNDNDGLLNSFEIALGTDPNDSDSDNDFLSDFDEINMDGDPSNYAIGIDTDPTNDDTDNDGQKDGLDLEPLINNPLEINVPILPTWAMLTLFLLMSMVFLTNNRNKKVLDRS